MTLSLILKDVNKSNISMVYSTSLNHMTYSWFFTVFLRLRIFSVEDVRDERCLGLQADRVEASDLSLDT